MSLPLPLAPMPDHVHKQILRAPQANIPATLEARQALRQIVRDYARQVDLVPPMPMSELEKRGRELIARHGIDARYLEYTVTLLNNELWRDQLAAVPFHRRLLLMPKCLRKEETCPAPFDEFGLLCKLCGQCSLQDLQVEAERLGYAVLIAEGSAIVMALVETGKIDAIVGVSCLSVLEKAYPYMESAAIPGVAIPLLQDDCADTNVDLDWVWEAIHLTSADQAERLDLDALKGEVDAWFTPQSLADLLGPAETRTEQIAHQVLAGDGKRWRPVLAASVWRALQDNLQTPLPDSLRHIAVAVECFHKASLVHDDIEDADLTRYEKPTVHAEHGIPVALNIGDYLVGEGYRLIAASGASSDQIARLLEIAATGHRDLSLGQGEELCWQQAPAALKPHQVLEIFRRKTAPAFEVALRMGAVLAGADDAVHEVLRIYSHHLGLAYQIRDDLDDWFRPESGAADENALRPTLLPALALERAKGPDRDLLQRYWQRALDPAAESQKLRNAMNELGVQSHAEQLLSGHKEQAIRALMPLDQHTLKGLLRRMITRIFGDLQIRGWCSEFEAANAAGRKARGESAA